MVIKRWGGKRVSMHVSPKRYVEIRALADKLIASCDGGMSYKDDIEALPLEGCCVLDSMTRECYVCGQWSDICEMTDHDGEWRCVDCSP